MCLSPIPLSPRFEFGCTGPGPPQKKIYESFTVGIATPVAASALAPAATREGGPAHPRRAAMGAAPLRCGPLATAVTTFVITAPLLAPTAGP